MSYKKAVQLLPDHLLVQIQEYVDGEFIYIPRKSDCQRQWGTKTSAREHYAKRNRQIYELYLEGSDTESLAEEYFLSLKSIQRIIREEKMKAHLLL